MLVAAAPLAVGAALLLTREEPRLAATNSVAPAVYVTTLEPGQRLCQPHQQLPAQAAAARLFAGVYGRPGPPMRVTVGQGARQVAAGSASGYGDGMIRVPLRRVARGPVGDATLCVLNRGPGRLALGGRPEPPSGTVVGATPLQARVYVGWLRPGRESWLDLAGTVAERAGVGKAGFMGAWTLWAALALIVAAAALALTTVVRWRPR
jgi:hypothetical protein